MSQEPKKRAREVLAATRHAPDCEFCLDLGARVPSCSCDYTIRAMIAFRTEALEEATKRAAMVADRRTRNHSAKLSQGYREAAHEIREAIRALASKGSSHDD